MSRIVLKHLERWPREQTRNREESAFRTTETHAQYGYRTRGREIPWSRTEAELKAELHRIGVREAVMQLAVRERDIRIDGGLRADAKPSHPGVVLSFTHPRQGPVTFACDKWVTWQANIRGITKALEALRLVDRYGITQSGEQYAGWKELPSGVPMSQGYVEEALSPPEAARIIAGAVSGPHDLGQNTTLVLTDPDFRKYAYRQAVKLAHPDAGAPESDGFLRIQKAMKLLEAEA